jgi:hypothetical protein
MIRFLAVLLSPLLKRVQWRTLKIDGKDNCSARGTLVDKRINTRRQHIEKQNKEYDGCDGLYLA